MYLVSIGTPERGLEFVEKTGFSADRLLADPTSSLYSVLEMKKGVRETFFAKETPFSIWEDIKSGRIEDLKEVMNVWTKGPLWIPPKQDQAFQQGGVMIFEGSRLLYVHKDPATGAHADLEEVVKVATEGISSSSSS